MKSHSKLQGISWLVLVSCLMTSCSLLFPSNKTMNSYKLDGISTKHISATPVKRSISVSKPTAGAGYNSQAMLYMQTNYQIAKFAKNQWLAPPADLLQPLIVQSLRNTGYFHAVAPTPLAAKTSYRLNTQLVKLQQNFITKPSFVEMVVQVALINSDTNQVVASQRLSQQVAAPSDDPYGGVLAANIACQQMMEQISIFVVNAARRG